jgi:hypothetical protein
MMTEIDLTPEAVERLAADLQAVAAATGPNDAAAIAWGAADTLRALSARLAEAREAISEMHDLASSHAARAEAAEAALASATRAKDCFQRMTRAHWEALCAMRNSINEHIPMPNTDSGPLFSPENGPIYADIAERVVARIVESKNYTLALEQELKDRAEAADAALATARADRDKWFEGAGAHHVASMREAQRADVAEHQRDQAVIALMHLERCAQVVSERGAQTGPQWTRLTSAILRARATMSKLPTPLPSNEPPLVQSALITQQEKPHE